MYFSSPLAAWLALRSSSPTLSVRPEPDDRPRPDHGPPHGVPADRALAPRYDEVRRLSPVWPRRHRRAPPRFDRPTTFFFLRKTTGSSASATRRPRLRYETGAHRPVRAVE